jgi:hypothetical protein
VVTAPKDTGKSPMESGSANPLQEYVLRVVGFLPPEFVCTSEVRTAMKTGKSQKAVLLGN